MIGRPAPEPMSAIFASLRQVLQQHQRFEDVPRRKLLRRTGRDQMEAVVPASE